MGCSVSKNDKVQPESTAYIRLPEYPPSPGDEFDLKHDSAKSDDFHNRRRKTTDVIFATFMSIFYVALLCLVGYCMYNGDIFRILNGYDNCGNVCGKQNAISRDIPCKGKDQTNFKYLLMEYSLTKDAKQVQRSCVQNCSAYNDARAYFNRCVPKKTEVTNKSIFSKLGLQNFFDEVSEDLHKCWREIVYMCLIALAFSIIILILFRYFVGWVVWIVLIGVTLACIIGTAALWYIYYKAKNNLDPELAETRNTSTYLIFAGLASIITLIVVLVVFVMRKRIQLVVRLFKEAGKAIGAMPTILFEPIITFAFLGLVLGIWFYFCLWIESSGILTKLGDEYYKYQKDLVMQLTRWINLLGMLWMVQFVIGCQHMVIAGAVAGWYFTRDKKMLSSPIFKSVYNLTRYHLGSVAVGSFLVALVQFARIILSAIQKYLKKFDGNCVHYILKCCQCCLWCFEQILKYLTRNAYIEVAIHGYSFCKAGKEAFKHLSANALRVAAINSVGDFVLLLAKVLVVISTVLIGLELIQRKDAIIIHLWVPLGLAAVFAYFVSHCFITVYEMAIDTIFLCFCEDCEKNDGISKPYYMSKGLMEFVENSKKALMELDANKGKKQAWQSASRPPHSRSNVEQ